MKTKPKNRVVRIRREGDQWKIQQLFGKLAAHLNRLPDAGEVQQNPLRSAPVEMTGMVF